MHRRTVLLGLLLLGLLDCSRAVSSRPASDNVPPRPAPEPAAGAAPAPAPFSPDDQDWDGLLDLARPTVPAAPHEALDLALELLRPVADVVDARLRAAGFPADPSSPPTDLPPDAADAVEAFVGWSRGEGGLPPADCASRTALRPLLTLARTALAAATDDPDDPRVAAALRLAWRLREEGVSRRHVLLGGAIAAEAVHWAKARGLGPSEAFRRYAPADGHLFRLVAAEAVCSGRPAAGAAPEEVDAVRARAVGRVAGAQARWDDPAAAERFLDEQAEAVRRDGDRSLPAPLGALLGRLRASRDEYLGFVRSASAR